MSLPLHVLYLVALTAGLGSCASNSKKEDPQPVAATTPAELSMTRTTTFPSAASRNSALYYTQQTLSGNAVLDDKRLYLNFVTPQGVDRINFEVPRASLTPGITGVYPLLGRTTPTGVATALYVFYRINVATSLSGNLYYSHQNEARGQLTITTYDAPRKLISGTYEMQLNNINDPTDATLPGAATLHCNVSVTGSFKDLPVE